MSYSEAVRGYGMIGSGFLQFRILREPHNVGLVQTYCKCRIGHTISLHLRQSTQGANHHIFVKTDMVCYKRLLYMVGFLRPPATTSGWTTFSIGYCNSEIQDGVQDGRRNLKSPYYHRFLLCSCAIHRFYGFRGQGIYLWWFQSDMMLFISSVS